MFAAAPAWAGGGFQAGYWEFALVKGGHTVESNRRCLTDIHELTRLSALNRQYCKRTNLSVRDGTISSRVHCKYPNLERTTVETLTFDGDSAHGSVRITEGTPHQRTVALEFRGRRLAPACPKVPEAGSRPH